LAESAACRPRFPLGGIFLVPPNWWLRLLRRRKFLLRFWPVRIGYMQRARLRRSRKVSVHPRMSRPFHRNGVVQPGFFISVPQKF
jgi:hypothetical protein